MKKLFLLFVLLFAITTFSQNKVITFHANSVLITQLSDDTEASQVIDMDIKFNDNYIAFDTGRYWTIVSGVTSESETSFYVYGIDSDNGSRARLWFKTIDGITWGLTISYNDYRFFYLCKYIESN